MMTNEETIKQLQRLRPDMVVISTRPATLARYRLADGNEINVLLADGLIGQVVGIPTLKD